MNTTGFNPEDVHGKSRHVLQDKDNDRAILAAIARQAMIERHLEPDFPPASLQEWRPSAGLPVRPTTCATCAIGSGRPSTTTTPATPRPTHGRRVDRERTGQNPRGSCGLGRPGAENLGDRRPCGEQHDLRLYAGRDLPHAPGGAVHRSDIVERGPGPDFAIKMIRDELGCLTSLPLGRVADTVAKYTMHTDRSCRLQ